MQRSKRPRRAQKYESIFVVLSLPINLPYANGNLQLVLNFKDQEAKIKTMSVCLLDNKITPGLVLTPMLYKQRFPYARTMYFNDWLLQKTGMVESLLNHRYSRNLLGCASRSYCCGVESVRNARVGIVKRCICIFYCEGAFVNSSLIHTQLTGTNRIGHLLLSLHLRIGKCIPSSHMYSYSFSLPFPHFFYLFILSPPSFQ